MVRRITRVQSWCWFTPSVVKMACEAPRNWSVPLNHIHCTNLEYPDDPAEILQFTSLKSEVFILIYHEFLRSGKFFAPKHRTYVFSLSIYNIISPIYKYTVSTVTTEVLSNFDHMISGSNPFLTCFSAPASQALQKAHRTKYVLQNMVQSKLNT